MLQYNMLVLLMSVVMAIHTCPLSNGCSSQACLTWDNELCVQCKDGYVLDQLTHQCIELKNHCTACGMEHCAIIRQDICIKCKPKYIMTATRQCIPHHIYSVLVEKCMYMRDGRCVLCARGYDIVGDGCKVSHCIKESQHKCVLCGKEYQLRDEICQKISKRIKHCIGVEEGGKCVECESGYRLASDQCMEKRVGCLYEGDLCVGCTEGYYLEEGRCKVKNCAKYGDMCEYCHHPYQLINTICVIPYCRKIEGNQCVECEDNSRLYNYGCILLDSNCIEFKDKTSAQCKVCRNEYASEGFRCVEKDHNCLEVIEGTNLCGKCRKWYYLNDRQECVIREKHCRTYINGFCEHCEGQMHQEKCQQKYKQYTPKQCRGVIDYSGVEYSSKSEEEFNIEINSDSEGWKGYGDGPHFVLFRFKWGRIICGIQIKDLGSVGVDEIQLSVGSTPPFYDRMEKHLLQKKGNKEFVQIIQFNKKFQGKYFMIRFPKGNPHIKLQVLYEFHAFNNYIDSYKPFKVKKVLNNKICSVTYCHDKIPCRISIQSTDIIPSSSISIKSAKQNSRFTLQYSLDGYSFNKIISLTKNNIRQSQVEATSYYIQMQNGVDGDEWCVNLEGNEGVLDDEL